MYELIYRPLAVVIIVIAAVMWFTLTVESPIKKEVAALKVQASVVQEARNTEQAIIKADVAVSKTYQDGLNEGKKELNAAISKLRAERMRQRERAASAASMPSNSATASRCDAEAGGDILEDMAKLAGEADDVARQLGAAQEFIRNRQ